MLLLIGTPSPSTTCGKFINTVMRKATPASAASFLSFSLVVIGASIAQEKTPKHRTKIINVVMREATCARAARRLSFLIVCAGSCLLVVSCEEHHDQKNNRGSRPEHRIRKTVTSFRLEGQAELWLLQRAIDIHRLQHRALYLTVNISMFFEMFRKSPEVCQFRV